MNNAAYSTTRQLARMQNSTVNLDRARLIDRRKFVIDIGLTIIAHRLDLVPVGDT